MKQCCSQNCTHFSATVVTGSAAAEPEAVTQEAHEMNSIWIAIIALLAVVVVATGCATTEEKADGESMSPPPTATALVITGSQAIPTSAPSMAASESESYDMDATWESGQEGFNQIGGTSTVNDEPYDLTFFQSYGVNPFIDTEDDRFSTFAMDVDTASYVVTRTFLGDGFLPDSDSVRVEEFVNYFEQEYEQPEEGAFSITVDGSPSQFGLDTHHMIRVGLQGKTVSEEARKDATLIFVIDVSGSMARQDRLGLAKRSLRLLVDELRDSDKIGIVIYGSTGHILLEPTSVDADHKQSIINAIDALGAGGSTYAEQGLELGYRMAADEADPERITRVILVSDGVANVGATGAESILKTIREYVDEGVTLTTIGLGMGNFNDVLMEQLANNGNGTYHYVDTLAEARRLFVENLAGTLQFIARDAKIQVEFDEESVRSYRLLGYENRDVADVDFRNDAVDAGEVGAGHSVTALYEIKINDDATNDTTLATVRVRYEHPDSGVVSEIEQSVTRGDLAAEFTDAPTRYQLAAVVAEFAELLRHSYWAREGNLSEVETQARRLRGLLPDDTDVAELADLASIAARIQQADAGS